MHAGRGAPVLVVRTDKYHIKAASGVVGTFIVLGAMADVCNPIVVDASVKTEDVGSIHLSPTKFLCVGLSPGAIKAEKIDDCEI